MPFVSVTYENEEENGKKASLAATPTQEFRPLNLLLLR